MDLLTQDFFPSLDVPLRLSTAYLHQLVYGVAYPPQYSEDFPATVLSTKKSWEDLILDEKTATSIAQARNWVKYYPVVKQPGAYDDLIALNIIHI